MEMEEIQAQCKLKFPIGCKFINAQKDKISCPLLEDDRTYAIRGDQIWAHDGAGCLYIDGVWATVLEYPEGYVAPEKEVNNKYEIY